MRQGAATLLHTMTLPACGAVAGLLARRITLARLGVDGGSDIRHRADGVLGGDHGVVDLALALHVGVAVLALMRAHDTADRRWLIVAGIQLGFACATKNLGLVALVSVVPVLAWSCLRMQPRRAAVASIVLVTVLALLVLCRGTSVHGGPLAIPCSRTCTGCSARGLPSGGTRSRSGGCRSSRTTSGARARSATCCCCHGTCRSTARSTGGTLGPLLLAGLPVVALVSVRRRTAAAMLAGTAIYGAIWASPVSSYQLRFLVPAWLPCAALLAAGTGLVLDRVRSPLARIAVHAALSLVLLVCLPPWTIFHDGDRRGWDGWLTHVVREPRPLSCSAA